MTTTITYSNTLALAADGSISPGRCRRCRRTPSFGLSWSIGCDDGRDPQWVGFQCRGCGHVQGMTRANILRRITAPAAARPGPSR